MAPCFQPINKVRSSYRQTRATTITLVHAHQGFNDQSTSLYLAMDYVMEAVLLESEILKNN